MKIAIAASENHMKSVVDPHFGRCNWFCIVDSETRKAEFIENSSRHHHEKAGHEAAVFLIGRGINLAIAGRFGSKVVEIFRTSNVQMVIPEQQQTIQEIINLIQ